MEVVRRQSALKASLLSQLGILQQKAWPALFVRDMVTDACHVFLKVQNFYQFIICRKRPLIMSYLQPGELKASSYICIDQLSETISRQGETGNLVYLNLLIKLKGSVCR